MCYCGEYEFKLISVPTTQILTFIGRKFLISCKMEFEAHIKLETFVSLFEMQMLTTLVVGSYKTLNGQLFETMRHTTA